MKEFKKGDWLFTLKDTKQGIMLHAGVTVECAEPDVGALIILNNEEVFLLMDINDGTVYTYDESTKKWEKYETK